MAKWVVQIDKSLPIIDGPIREGEETLHLLSLPDDGAYSIPIGIIRESKPVIVRDLLGEAFALLKGFKTDDEISDDVEPSLRGIWFRADRELMESEWVQSVLGHFGLSEAVRSDQSFEQLSIDLSEALNRWLGRPGEMMQVMWVMSDRIIASSWLLPGESIESPRRGVKRRIWEIQYSRSDSGISFGTITEVKEVRLYEPVTESSSESRLRFSETTQQVMVPVSGRRVRGYGITADVVNANKRRYPRTVLAEAIRRLTSHLNESNGQGRLVLLTGEAEHPGDKGGRSSLLETVVKWDSAVLDASGKVLLEGEVLPTAKGKDIQVLIESRIPIGISMRGYGSVKAVREGKVAVDEVTSLTITGFDLVSEPSDPNGQIIESKNEEGDVTMELKDILALLRSDPAMTEGIMKSLGLTTQDQLVESLGASSLKDIETRLGEAKALKEEKAAAELQSRIETAITESTKGLKYGDEMNKLFVESIRGARPASPEAVKPLVEAKIKEYDAMASAAKLATMGRQPTGPLVERVASAFEDGTGRKEFTRVSFELNESLHRAGEGANPTGPVRNLAKPETKAEIFAAAALERFDKLYQARLIQEARSFEEAEQTSDLNLPYSVARLMIEQAYPELVAANIYDFGTTDMAPARIYYEFYEGESGSAPAVANEAATSDEGAWVSLDHARIKPGTVVVTGSGATPTYVEGDDYVIDYELGKIWTITGGAIGDGTTLEIDYTYDAYRQGEMSAIERAKNTLTFTTLDIAADRLAMEISQEAIQFSRSQLGYDAVTRTLGNLARLVRRKIDKDILYKGLAASLIQASNSGGTWNSGSDTHLKLIEYMGYARVKVYNRYYMPTAFLMSVTNADVISNWDGFRTDGFPNAMLNAAGFAGSLKGLPVFMSTEYSDSYVQAINRELVMHRVYNPLTFKGPFPSYSNGKLVSADQYYAEEFNGSLTPVVEKTAHVVIT